MYIIVNMSSLHSDKDIHENHLVPKPSDFEKTCLLLYRKNYLASSPSVSLIAKNTGLKVHTDYWKHVMSDVQYIEFLKHGKTQIAFMIIDGDTMGCTYNFFRWIDTSIKHQHFGRYMRDRFKHEYLTNGCDILPLQINPMDAPYWYYELGFDKMQKDGYLYDNALRHLYPNITKLDINWYALRVFYDISFIYPHVM